jgi:hypothetical protein
MSLALHLQSAHEALRECVQSLLVAREEVEELEEQGAKVACPSGDLDRVISQCQAAQRKLDQWRARL